ncbi:hypothetical protein PsorP6_010613 [Peronosclerospora sorghi]|uniref:Uncharacterized protein n=1 Tax=Peronosclerospora sorghi TaxID=230839 RepID=A0ACC0VVP6_9STRA|nr:hypothetical protein PsorP6_010613 [Peronosclerospora sorghi]
MLQIGSTDQEKARYAGGDTDTSQDLATYRLGISKSQHPSCITSENSGIFFASNSDANAFEECIVVKLSSLSSKSPIPYFSKPDAPVSLPCVSTGNTNQLSDLDTLID